MSITERYADYCAGLPDEELPAPVVDRARELLLDVCGIAIGAARAGSTPSIVKAARALDGGGEGATVLATGEQMRPELAAFVNASLAHSLDYDETHRAGSIHPAASVVGAALAAGEHTDADGDRLLTAIVGGYEVAARLGMAISPASHMARGFHGTGTCGTFGATAAAGIVYGLDRAGFETAFGVNGSQAAGSLQFLEDGAWNKRTHPGFAARSALSSVALAEQDFEATAAPIEGVRGFLQGYSDDADPALATAGLGDRFEITQAGIKPYPCCRYMHAAMDGLLELASAEGIDQAAVTAVEIGLAGAARDVVEPTKPVPETVVDAQFSMPFATALTLTRRRATVEDFLAVERDELDADRRRLIEATSVTTSDWADDQYPDRWAATVRIETTDDTYETRVESARGDPENPLSWAELTEKYAELVEPVMGEAGDALGERIASADSQSVRELLEPVRTARDDARIDALERA